MNVKRILLIGLILVAAVASLSFVSADSSVKVGGMDFNIPDGFSENESFAQDGKDNTIDGAFPHKLSTKLFNDGTDLVAIEVLEFDSPDDAKKMYDHDKASLTGTKTVNGKEGEDSTAASSPITKKSTSAGVCASVVDASSASLSHRSIMLVAARYRSRTP